VVFHVREERVTDQQPTRILAGDLGGTKCTLTLFSVEGPTLEPLCRFSALTREFANVGGLLDSFREYARREGFEVGRGALTSVALGVAGTIVEDQVVSNNLTWTVGVASVASSLGLATENVLLLNDLVATASSLAHLKPSDVLPLNEGAPQYGGAKALIAAGTGLGEAILYWDRNRYRVFPSEAGLSDFSPRTDREFLLVQSLRQRMSHVCVEEVVSGRGFRDIHQIIFPDVQHSWFEDPAVDAAARITQQGLGGECHACSETLQIWTEAYGAEAGNMALRILPFGGVYVAGGIALKILPKLKDGSFVRAFSDKQKLSTQLAKIPIFVVLNEDAPVLGSAYAALEALRETGDESYLLADRSPRNCA